MFEGKELSGKLPNDLGDYGIDIKDEGVVDAEVAANLNKSFFSDILKAKGTLSLTLQLDGKAVVNKLLGSSENFMAKLIVSAVNGLKKADPVVAPETPVA